MPRLTAQTIQQILVEHSQGEAKSVIARRHEVDVSTVKYHVEKFENHYGSTSAVYSLIPPTPRACQHPSLKCLVCGKAQDHIHRREREEIAQLTQRLDRANTILERHGYDVE